MKRAQPILDARTKKPPLPPIEASTRTTERTVRVDEVRCVVCGTWYPRLTGGAITCGTRCRQSLAAMRRARQLPPFRVRRHGEETTR